MPLSLRDNVSLFPTCFVYARVVCDLHGIQLQSLGALAQAVEPGDVGALIRDGLHHLQKTRKGIHSDLNNDTNHTKCPSFKLIPLHV